MKKGRLVDALLPRMSECRTQQYAYRQGRLIVVGRGYLTQVEEIDECDEMICRREGQRTVLMLMLMWATISCACRGVLSRT